MKAVPLIVLALAAGIATPNVNADGLPVLGVKARAGGVGGNVRYEVFPYEGNTFVQRIRRGSEAPLGSRVVHGRFDLPVVAYDGSVDGLSADGRTLVLIAPRRRFPRATTSFAVLDAPTLRLRRTLRLRGDYSFDALSPDGRWLYLIHYTSPSDRLRYEVVAADVRTGRLAPEPIVDPREPDEQMNGHPLTRATSGDGRWAYTLYDGREHPFVHALDTSKRDARCIDLHWLAGRRGLRELRLAVDDAHRELVVRTKIGEPVAVVDAATFEARRPAGAGSWPKTGLSALALLAALGGMVYVVRTRRA